MTKVEFVKSVDSKKLEEARTFTSISIRNGVKSGTSYYFQAITKEKEVVAFDGNSWDEIFKKLPENLKKTVPVHEFSI